MAGYNLKPKNGGVPCSQGQGHVVSVSLWNGPNPMKDVSVAQALFMQQNGDSLVIGLPNGWQARADFIPCACGQGYLLKQGPTAAELPLQPLG